MTNVVMVTGGAGFVGSFLVERLLEEGEEVHVFDRKPLAEAKSLQAVRDHPGLRYVEGDLRDADAIRRFYRPDASTLYHLGSIVGVRHYMTDPLMLIDVVVGGTRQLLAHALEHGTRVLFSSTSEIYGRNPEIPWRETSDRVLGPASIDRWCYSSSKSVCEHMLFALFRHAGLPFSTVRFFNLYGPRQEPMYVVSQSVYKALRGERPLRYDGGRQTRCFTYIEDAIEGVIRASREPKAIGEAFNIGADLETSVGRMIDLAVEAAGGNVEVEEFDTGREYGAVYEDIGRRVPEVGKARELLGWRATTSMEEGLRRTVAWARANDWWLADR